MINIIQIGHFEAQEVIYNQYGLKKKDDFIDKTIEFSPDKTQLLNNYLESKKYILSNYKDENQKLVQQIILPPRDGTTIFDISRNYVNYIPFDLLPDSIKKLDVSHTFINQTEIKTFPTSAEYIKISETPIEKIGEIPVGVKFFIARGCGLKNIGIVPPIIEELYLDGNNLSRLPPNLLECNSLKQLSYEGNANLITTEEELNHIERIFERRRRRDVYNERVNRQNIIENIEERANFIETEGGFDNNFIKKENLKEDERMNDKIMNIFNDSQNVHDSMINANMAEASLNLQKFYLNNEDILNDIEDTKKESKLRFFVRKTFFERIRSIIGKRKLKFLETLINNKLLIFSRIDMSFGNIFYYVFFRIYFLEKEVQDEIFDMLKHDMNEMNNVCLTGKIGRIINLLNGKCDEVKLIGETLKEKLMRIYHLCKVQATANYKKLVYKEIDFDKRKEIKIDENSFLFRKILYILFENEIKLTNDVDEEEVKVWLEPLIFTDEEEELIKSSGNKEEDEKIIEEYAKSIIDNS